MANQNPEQIARDNIDKQLIECGWIIQKKKQINLSAGLGVAVTEYQTEIGESSDYRFGDGVHDIPFSKKRARCILWIKEVITAAKGHIERRGQLRQSKRRRVLIVVEEKYVVVLEMGKKPKELEFIAAFIADEQYLQRIRKESSLLEIKNPSLNGD
jgi:hypothetical protein